MSDCDHRTFDRDCDSCWARRTFNGCSWLGVESFRAPKHKPVRLDLMNLRGTRNDLHREEVSA